jgi:hypothetical protein
VSKPSPRNIKLTRKSMGGNGTTCTRSPLGAQASNELERSHPGRREGWATLLGVRRSVSVEWRTRGTFDSVSMLHPLLEEQASTSL